MDVIGAWWKAKPTVDLEKLQWSMSTVVGYWLTSTTMHFSLVDVDHIAIFSVHVNQIALMLSVQKFQSKTITADSRLRFPQHLPCSFQTNLWWTWSFLQLSVDPTWPEGWIHHDTPECFQEIWISRHFLIWRSIFVARRNVPTSSHSRIREQM